MKYDKQWNYKLSLVLSNLIYFQQTKLYNWHLVSWSHIKLLHVLMYQSVYKLSQLTANFNNCIKTKLFSNMKKIKLLIFVSELLSAIQTKGDDKELSYWYDNSLAQATPFRPQLVINISWPQCQPFFSLFLSLPKLNH